MITVRELLIALVDCGARDSDTVILMEPDPMYDKVKAVRVKDGGKHIVYVAVPVLRQKLSLGKFLSNLFRPPDVSQLETLLSTPHRPNRSAIRTTRP